MILSSRARASSLVAASDSASSPRSRSFACLVAVASIAVAGFTFSDGKMLPVPSPYLSAFVAALWLGGQFLTACLFFGRFYVNGRLSYAVLGAAFLLATLLSVPFVLFFPTILPIGGASRSNLQLSPWIFFARAASPAVIAIVWSVVESAHVRRISRARMASVMWISVLAAFATAFALTAIVVAFRGQLPILLDAKGYTTLAHRATFPALCVVNIVAATLFVVRRRVATHLDVWLAVAFAVVGLGCGLAAQAASRFSPAFVGGTIEIDIAMLIVLFVLTVESVEGIRHLATLSRIDPLTDLRNRRAFADELVLGFETTAARRASVAIALVDVDHFKDYNDRYGHAQGDACLAHVANVLRTTLRWPHLLGRYGGEEFVVALWGCEPEAAIYAAERLREAVAAARIEHKGAKFGVVTISIGLAHGEALSSDPTGLVDSADRALYAAKMAGRNTVVTRSGATMPDPLAQRFH